MQVTDSMQGVIFVRHPLDGTPTPDECNGNTNFSARFIYIQYADLFLVSPKGRFDEKSRSQSERYHSVHAACPYATMRTCIRRLPHLSRLPLSGLTILG